MSRRSVPHPWLGSALLGAMSVAFLFSACPLGGGRPARSLHVSVGDDGGADADAGVSTGQDPGTDAGEDAGEGTCEVPDGGPPPSPGPDAGLTDCGCITGDCDCPSDGGENWSQWTIDLSEAGDGGEDGGCGKRFLITGFTAFEGVPDNPSCRILRSQALQNAIRDRCGGRACLTYHSLPVRPGVLAEVPGFPCNYDVVISLGVDPNTMTEIRVETTATNCYQCSGEPRICIDRCRPADATLQGSSLPANLARDGGSDAGLSVTIGNARSCGTFVCNNTFYLACQQVDAGTLQGCHFIHLPFLPRERDQEVVGVLADTICRLIEHRLDAGQP